MINKKTHAFFFIQSIWLFTLSYLLNYALNCYVSNHVSTELYGDFSIAINFMSLTAPIYLMGTQSSLNKYFTKYISSDNQLLASEYIQWNVKTVIHALIIFLPIIFIITSIFIILEHEKIDFLQQYHLAFFFQLAAPIVGLTLLLGSIFLALRRFFIANITMQLLQNLSYLALFFILFSTKNKQDINHFDLSVNIIFGSSLWLIISLSALSLCCGHRLMTYFSNSIQRNTAHESEWSKYGLLLLLNSSLYILIGFLDLLIIEITSHHGEHNVGHYAAMLTITSAIMIPTNAIRQILKPILASHSTNKIKQANLNLGNLFQFAFLAVITTVICVFSKELLHYFGPNYSQFSRLLMILIIGNTLSLLPNLCFFDPLYNGYEKALLWQNNASIIMTIFISTPCYYFFGLAGMIWSIIFIKNFISYALFMFVKTKTKLKYMYFL